MSGFAEDGVAVSAEDGVAAGGAWSGTVLYVSAVLAQREFKGPKTTSDERCGAAGPSQASGGPRADGGRRSWRGGRSPFPYTAAESLDALGRLEA